MKRKTGDLGSNALVEILACLEYREGDLGGFLNGISRGFSDLLGFDWTVVTLLEDPQHIRLVGDSAPGSGSVGATLELHGTVISRVIDGAEPFCVTDIRVDGQGCAIPGAFVAYLGVPLKTATGDVIGTLCSFDRSVRRCGDADVSLARVFAARAAAAIEQYRAAQALAEHNQRLERAVEQRTAELYAAQRRLIQRERLAAIGELSAKIVHEVRSPLATMTMAMDHLQQVELPASSKKRLLIAQEEAGRLNRLLTEILNYATPGQGPREWVDINALIGQTVTDFNEAGGPPGGPLRIQCRYEQAHPRLFANSDKLRQVMINLLGNALDASPNGAVVWVETETDSERSATIRVRNRAASGALDAERVLEPFYSTKPRGSGLGLAIVNGIVESLQGRFSITQDDAGEVTAEVRLPVSAKEPALRAGFSRRVAAGVSAGDRASGPG